MRLLARCQRKNPLVFDMFANLIRRGAIVQITVVNRLFIAKGHIDLAWCGPAGCEGVVIRSLGFGGQRRPISEKPPAGSWLLPGRSL
jgi:hypothetical protein